MTRLVEDGTLSASSHASPAMSHTALSASVASDGVSLASASFTNAPAFVAMVNPAPEYISQANASQLATEVIDGRRDGDSNDGTPWSRSGRAAVAGGAVGLVNAFLDKQLYDMLSVAKSTSLVVLRPAVADVLRKKLARDAIASAEENLEDLLALDADGESEDEVRPPSQASAKWNVEFTWKRLRLRVMMRSEKSEFDIDDDERYVHEEAMSTTVSETAGVIGLATEIFLAGVLDYLADMLLGLAAQSAVLRCRRHDNDASAAPNAAENAHILVQECDIEKAALNSALDRQWRTWRKSLRSASRTSQPGQSASSSPVVDRRGSLGDRFPDRPEHHYPEHILASNIPLPITARDVDEIEVPGLARDPDQLSQVPQPSNQMATRAQSLIYVAQTDHVNTSRHVSVPTPLVTPFVDAPGAWPGETPTVEDFQPELEEITNTDEHVSGSQASDPTRPESKDSAHTELGAEAKEHSETEDQVTSLRPTHRPKRLAIYGLSNNRYNTANIPREGLESIQDQPPLSPQDFLASRNLGATSSLNSITSTEGDATAADTRTYESSEEEDQVITEPPSAEKLPSPLARAFPGLGLTRTSSDSSRRTPTSDQRVSLDFMKSRRTSKLTDSASNSPGKRGSLRQIATGRDSLDERRKVTTPLTSEQEFDMLLNSEDTVKYTLTPDSVRDVVDRPYSPQFKLHRSKLSTGSRENLFKKQQDNSDAQSIRSFRSATWSIGGSKDKNDNPPIETRRKTSISRPVPKNTAPLPSGHVAREPVMQTESTRDFADFIRSTGPDKEPNPIIPLLASRSMSSLRATAATQASILAEPNNKTLPPVPVVPKTAGKYIPRSPLGPPKSRPALRSGMMARAASGNSDSNNDLIDFIRSGPPGAGGKARVPNHIAPFADFDDEDEDDDLRTVISGAIDFPRTSASMYRPSTSNSRTGLLNGGAGNFYHSNSSQLTQQLPPVPSPKPPSSFNVPAALPATATPIDTQRKRTRIKDPYAIPDDSDDEDDLLSALPGDRVNEPLVGSAAARLTSSDSAQAAAGAERGRANSVNSLQSSSSKPSPSIGGGKIPTLSPGMLHSGISPNPGYEPSIGSVHSATSNAAIRPAHITSQVSSGGLIPRNRSKMEVRPAGGSKNARLEALHNSSTNDLADFLKSSGPPEPPSRRGADSAPAPVVGSSGAKPEKKKSTKFWQRKATYLDMP